MFKKIFSCVTIVLSLLATGVQAAPGDFDDLSILVSSCDKYAQFWDPFFKLLDVYWPELSAAHMPMYLLANTQKYPSQRIKMINIPNELSWSDNMLTALDQINTKYVLLFLDDYWLNARVDQSRLLELFNFMKKEDAAYMQLHIDSQEAKLSKFVPNLSGVAYKNKFQKYRAALQLAIWETKALKQLLRSGESAWDFEMAASIRSSGYPKEFFTVQNNAPIRYLNASNQGHMQPDALALAKKQNPNFVSSLPILKQHNWDLYVKHLKHRAHTAMALVKRNISDNQPDSYRYTFEERN